MSKASGIGGGKSPEPHRQEEPKKGSLQGHKVIQQKGPDLSGQVPKKSPPEGPSKFKAVPQRGSGGFLGFILTFLKSFFGGNKQSTDKKSALTPEEKKWQKLVNGSTGDKIKFLRELQQKQPPLNTSLGKLEKRVKEHLFKDPVPALEYRYDSIKKNGIDKEPAQILSLRADIEQQLTSLQEIKVDEIIPEKNPLKEMKDKAIEELHNLKNQITEDIGVALKEAEKEVESKLPHNELEAQAVALNKLSNIHIRKISIKGETFAEKRQNFLRDLESSEEPIKAAEDAIEGQVKTFNSKVQAAQIALNRAKQEQQQHLEKAKAEQEQLIAKQKEAFFLQWEDDNPKEINKLTSLKSELEEKNPVKKQLQDKLAQLQKINRGEVKTKGSILSPPKTQVLTQEEKKRLAELPGEIAQVAKTNDENEHESKIAQQESEIASLKEKAWGLNALELTRQATDSYEKSIKELSDEKNLPEYKAWEAAEKNLIAFQEKNNASQIAFNAFFKANEAAQKGLMTAKMNQKDFRESLEKLMTLTYLQKLNKDFKSNYRSGLPSQEEGKFKHDFETKMEQMSGFQQVSGVQQYISDLHKNVKKEKFPLLTVNQPRQEKK